VIGRHTEAFVPAIRDPQLRPLEQTGKVGILDPRDVPGEPGDMRFGRREHLLRSRSLMALRTISRTLPNASNTSPALSISTSLQFNDGFS
jgi:hypothetical protein